MQTRIVILILIGSVLLAACSNPDRLYIVGERHPTSLPQPTATSAATVTPQATETATVIAQDLSTATPAGPNADLVITEALRTMADARTFHFVMEKQYEMSSNSPYSDYRIPVSGKVHTPDCIEGNITFNNSGEIVSVDFIAIGEELYLKETKNGIWQALEPQSSTAQIIRQNAFLPLAPLAFSDLENAVFIGDEQFQNIPVFHVRALVQRETADSTDAPVRKTIDYWIGKEDHAIYRIVLRATADANDRLYPYSDSTTQVDYTNYGKPVLIIAPLLEEPPDFRPFNSYTTVSDIGMLLEEVSTKIVAD